jgi:hypothetical protein
MLLATPTPAPSGGQMALAATRAFFHFSPPAVSPPPASRRFTPLPPSPGDFRRHYYARFSSQSFVSSRFASQPDFRLPLSAAASFRCCRRHAARAAAAIFIRFSSQLDAVSHC